MLGLLAELGIGAIWQDHKQFLEQPSAAPAAHRLETTE